MKERLQKFISNAGITSRRNAEKLIVAGKIKVNGQVVTELGSKVDPSADQVEVEGKKITLQRKIYLVLNKPKKYVTTRKDKLNRKTVYDLLPAIYRNLVWPVGRLDYTTEGLLIFTNDGELTQTLTHPSKEHEKEYEVVLDKALSAGRADKIRNGMMLDGKKTSPAKLQVNGKTVRLTIHEGWNRQIKRMFAAFGLTVRSIKRIRIGKLQLSGLELGQSKIIQRKDII
ncbi:MAG: rRNA pseudouridine synthase [Candidatus Doudnabacteria bacterium]|nr:rRNA pseudouridine synthase [Candidatus Doudnabacteria bacterium]